MSCLASASSPAGARLADGGAVVSAATGRRVAVVAPFFGSSVTSIAPTGLA